MESNSILFIILIISFIIQLIYNWYFIARLSFYKPKPVKNEPVPLSVIICARNEYHNLEKNLPLILEQDYPDYEVVLVDDRSNDDSNILLKEFQGKYPNLNVVKIKSPVNFFKGKKLALSVGIKSSKNKILVLTDADCKPASRNWLKTISRSFSNGYDIVLGYGAYEKAGGLLNSLVRYESITTAINYFSFCLAKIPYMGVGRNLAYKKELFFKAGGFVSHYKISSGDDDLFINQVANAKNTTIELDPKSFTISTPEKTFKNWFLQKKRHFSTSKYYNKKHKFLLGIFSFTNFLFYVSLGLVLSYTGFWQWGILLFGIKLLSLMINYYFSAKKFSEKILFLYSPLYDLFFAFLNPIILLSSLIYKKNKWK